MTPNPTFYLIGANLLAQMAINLWRGKEVTDGVGKILAEKRRVRLIAVPEISFRLFGFEPSAMTLGDYIFVKEHLTNNLSLLAHELVHTEEQWRKYGDVFAPMYLLASLYAALRYGPNRAYSENPFEKEAYEKQKDYLPQLKAELTHAQNA